MGRVGRLEIGQRFDAAHPSADARSERGGDREVRLLSRLGTQRESDDRVEREIRRAGPADQEIAGELALEPVHLRNEAVARLDDRRGVPFRLGREQHAVDEVLHRVRHVLVGLAQLAPRDGASADIGGEQRLAGVAVGVLQVFDDRRRFMHDESCVVEHGNLAARIECGEFGRAQIAVGINNAGGSINKKVLSASHFYATKWEFDIIERANPDGYEISSIKQDLQKKQRQYSDLKGMVQLKDVARYRDFLDLCGQLRFQARWANLHRVPKTSVIGHSLFVAVLSYLFSLEISACDKRCVNNYFTGLFHDLPEVLTRDIISPVKRSVEGLSALIKQYEKEQMEHEVYGLIPKKWHKDVRTFTEREFDSIITLRGRRKKLGSDEISERYNADSYNPRDGVLVKAADSLAAFIEAYVAIRNGSYSREFQEAKLELRNTYGRATIAGINFGEIYADFD